MAPPQKSIDLPELQRATLQQARTQSLVPMKYDAGMDPSMGLVDRIGLDGCILAGPRRNKLVILDNLAKRTIRARLEEVNRKEKSNLARPGWYSLRRIHGTAVRAESNLETTSRALGNSEGLPTGVM
jgi:hypothetical protein